MDRAKLIERLMVTFLEELQEHTRVFNRELLALERQPSGAHVAESIKVLFRSAHSLKGAARSVQAKRLESLCHRLEEMLAAIRDGKRALDRDAFGQLFAAVDAFADARKELSTPPDKGPPVAVAPSEALPPKTPPSATATVAAARLPAATLPWSRPEGATAPFADRADVVPRGVVAANATGHEEAAAGVDPPGGRSPSATSASATSPSSASPGAASPGAAFAGRPSPSAASAGATVPGATFAAATSRGATSAAATSPGATALSATEPSAASPQAGVAAPDIDVRLGPAPNQRPGRATRTAASKPIEERGSVRVPRRRLDALLSQSGELLVARSRFDARHGEAKALQDTLALWRSEWRLAEQALKRWNRQQRAGTAHLELPPRLERFLRGGGAQLARVERDLERLSLGMAEDRRTLERAAAPLQDQIHKARLMPFAEACESLFRTVRDLCSSLGKEAALRVEAGDTELDRSIVEGLRDPLLHLVRNAMAHGAEPPDQRVALGKPRGAAIVIRAASRGDAVEVSVSDDGRGLDLAAIRARALERGLGDMQEERDLVNLIFEPGFSTQATVSEVAGRGVGLDVVRSQIEALRGNVRVTFSAGAGSCFTLSLPLTLTTLRVLLLKAAGDYFALPSSSVLTMVRAGARDLAAIAGRDMLLLGQAPIPVASLAQTLGAGGTTSALRSGDKLPMVVLGLDQQRVAIAVDELIAEQDIVLKAFGARLGRPKHFAGASVLASGQIALVLKPLELARTALGRAPSLQWSEQLATRTHSSAKRLLLVDDSITTRTLEKSILESAGHAVTTAADGLSAWQILQEQGADLVVSDVEMPNMDGFTLTQTIRSSKRFKDLPVILLTALHSEQDRARGLELGADAYLLKTTFDQKQLLETIRQLL